MTKIYCSREDCIHCNKEDLVCTVEIIALSVPNDDGMLTCDEFKEEE